MAKKEKENLSLRKVDVTSFFFFTAAEAWIERLNTVKPHRENRKRDFENEPTIWTH